MLISGLLTGFARIYIGEHWPIDILGAIVAGTLGLVIAVYSWKRFEPIWRPLIDYSRAFDDWAGKQFKELK